MKTFWAIASIAIIGWGALETFAFMMSDNPTDADSHAKRGCLVAVVGVVSLLVCLAYAWVLK